MRIARTLIVILIAGAAVSCSGANSAENLSPAMVVSVSSDGDHVVTSHRNNELVLWDLDNRQHQVLSNDANIYSAYFVKGRDIFLWQDLDNLVHVQEVSGKTIETFKNFPTYGQVMGPDLEHYVASKENWQLYTGHGEDQQPLKTDGEAPSFGGMGKLLNLQLGANGTKLLSAGDTMSAHSEVPIDETSPIEADDSFSEYAGVVLWNLETGKPVQKFIGNAVKTHASLSPTGDNVVAVDENGKSFRWSIPHEKRSRLSRLNKGIYIGGHDPGSPKNRDTSGMHLHKPKDFPDDFNSGERIAVQYIGREKFIVFSTGEPYSVLYHTGDPFARKIFKLGKNPFPSVSDYSRNASIDTAPKAGVLVTGQNASGGINVYHFDSGDKTLERVWASTP